MDQGYGVSDMSMLSPLCRSIGHLTTVVKGACIRHGDSQGTLANSHSVTVCLYTAGRLFT